MKLLYKPFAQLFFIILLLAPNLAYSVQHILIYRDSNHKGDDNQASGIVRAYTQRYKDVKVEKFNVGEEENLKTSAQNAINNKEEKPIILAVGEKTIVPFAGLLPVEGAVTVHACHMVTKNHPDLLGKVDYIAVPVHAIGDFADAVKDSKTKLIETVGVAHNRQVEEIERAYNDSKIA